MEVLMKGDCGESLWRVALLTRSFAVAASTIAFFAVMRPAVPGDFAPTGDEKSELLPLPAGPSDLLTRGLDDYCPDSVSWWEACHSEMIHLNSEQRTSANLAMALIFARAGKYDHMRRLLQSTRTDCGGELMIRRLLSWAQASDFMIAEACATTEAMIDTMVDNLPRFTAEDKQICTSHAGQILGFASACGSVVQDGSEGDIRSTRTHILRRIYAFPKAVAIFKEAEDRIADEVAERFESVLAAQALVREEQIADKHATRERLSESLEEIAANKRGALVTAEAIQMQLLQAVSALDRKIAPVRSAESSYSSVLGELEDTKSRMKTEVGREAIDPVIAVARGRLHSLRSDIAAHEASVRQLEAMAVSRLNELGVRLDWLDRNETADRIRLRLNELKSETGKIKGIAGQLRVNSRLSAYAPLNFELEAERFHRVDWQKPSVTAESVTSEEFAFPSLD